MEDNRDYILWDYVHKSKSHTKALKIAQETYPTAYLYMKEVGSYNEIRIPKKDYQK
jgi:hypothetical protein